MQKKKKRQPEIKISILCDILWKKGSTHGHAPCAVTLMMNNKLRCLCCLWISIGNLVERRWKSFKHIDYFVLNIITTCHKYWISFCNQLKKKKFKSPFNCKNITTCSRTCTYACAHAPMCAHAHTIITNQLSQSRRWQGGSPTLWHLAMLASMQHELRPCNVIVKLKQK